MVLRLTPGAPRIITGIFANLNGGASAAPGPSMNIAFNGPAPRFKFFSPFLGSLRCSGQWAGDHTPHPAIASGRARFEQRADELGTRAGVKNHHRMEKYHDLLGASGFAAIPGAGEAERIRADGGSVRAQWVASGRGLFIIWTCSSGADSNGPCRLADFSPNLCGGPCRRPSAAVRAFAAEHHRRTARSGAQMSPGLGLMFTGNWSPNAAKACLSG